MDRKLKLFCCQDEDNLHNRLSHPKKAEQQVEDEWRWNGSTPESKEKKMIMDQHLPLLFSFAYLIR